MKKKVIRLSEDLVAALNRKDIEAIRGAKLEDVENLDVNKRSLLLLAVISGFNDAVSLLLEKGVNPNLKDKLGWSALHYAAQNYDVEIASLLINNGADVNCQDEQGNTPLGRAAFESRGRGEIIKLLLSKGSDYNLKNNYGVSPLGLANTIANYDIKQFFPR